MTVAMLVAYCQNVSTNVVSYYHFPFFTFYSIVPLSTIIICQMVTTPFNTEESATVYCLLILAIFFQLRMSTILLLFLSLYDTQYFYLSNLFIVSTGKHISTSKIDRFFVHIKDLLIMLRYYSCFFHMEYAIFLKFSFSTMFISSQNSSVPYFGRAVMS